MSAEIRSQSGKAEDDTEIVFQKVQPKGKKMENRTERKLGGSALYKLRKNLVKL